MIHILSWLRTQISNPLVGGGFVLMLSGAAMALCRSAPGALWEWLKKRVTVGVEVLNNDPLFDSVGYWLNFQECSKRSRMLTATTPMEITGELPPARGETRKAAASKVLFTPSPGIHFFFYRGRLVRLVRTREKGPGSSSGDVRVALRRTEEYTFTTLGRRQDGLRQLVGEIAEFASHEESGIRINYSTYGYWQSTGRLKPRGMETVVLPAGTGEGVLAAAREFLNKREWYRSMGIPWHMGMLFEGCPGSGKTSLTVAVAGELGMDLYLLNIAGRTMSDEQLSNLMADVRPGTMVLMEDADCTVPDRRDGESKGVTLSGLLNCLDGVMSREGCIIVMTTNYADRLDAALVRPGRVDLRVRFESAGEEQIRALHAKFGDGRQVELVVAACARMTMAEVQQYLMKGRETSHAGYMN